MNFQSNIPKMSDRDRGQYGIARAKHIAFDAISGLWRRRRTEGMEQLDIAKFTEQSPSTVSRNLSGPGNWTLRTLGLYVEALNGELEITIHAMEDPLEPPTNYDAYAEKVDIDWANSTPNSNRGMPQRAPLLDNADRKEGLLSQGRENDLSDAPQSLS